MGSSPLTRGKHRHHRCQVFSRGLIPAHAGKTRRGGPRRPEGQAHPRSRGENQRVCPVMHRLSGSSPLTRGKLCFPRSQRDTDGLIPAHAGKTSWRRSRIARASAHPRSRGENTLTSTGVAVKAGSSPLTRGKRRFVGITAIKRGLIPAHAGKTRTHADSQEPSWAHPRSRGENTSTDATNTRATGSSPLTRGKPEQVAEFKIRPRLIPAHAGKTPV